MKPASGIVRNFALYGSDESAPAWAELVHLEYVPERSGLFDWEIDLHFHEGLIQLLYLTKGGEGSAYLDGVRWALRPPCLVLIPARAVHGFSFHPDTDGPVITAAQKPLETVMAVINPGLLELLRQPMVLEVPAQSRQAQMLLPLFDVIHRESLLQSSGSNAATALLAALLVQVKRIAATASHQALHSRSRKAERIERFKSMLDEDLHLRKSSQDYANALGITVGQLSRLTRELLGMSAQEVINARIVHEAQRELAYSLRSVKQIAAGLGFHDEAYFCRFFKKHTGLRPTAFREHARQQFAET